jgi:prepilin-type N-terminal cleavage/methylation domain-containing protein
MNEPRRTTPRSEPSRGFTLIELLVAIAIIAILVGILVPALGGARAQARATLCVSNVRQQGVSVLAYVNDFTGHLPPRIIYWKEPSDTDPTGFVSGPWLINAFLARYEGRPFRRREFGWDAPTDIWRCPELHAEDDDRRQAHNGVLHHAPNMWLFSQVVLDEIKGTLRVDNTAPDPWAPRYATKSWRTLDHVSRTSDIVMLMDNVDFFFTDHGHRDTREHIAYANDLIIPTSTSPNDNKGTHDALGVRPTVFADGHAEAMKVNANQWLDARHAYTPGASAGASTELHESEAKHLLWFVNPGSFRAGGGDD